MNNPDKSFANKKESQPAQNDSMAKLRSKAEEIFNRSDSDYSDNFDGISTETLKELFHELRVHQIELEMQNDELRKTRDSLELSRAKYFDLYDLAPVGYLTLDSKGIILEANLTSAKILGLPRMSLVKQPFSKFILNSDFSVYFKNQKTLLEERIPQSYELHVVNEDGVSKNVLLDLNILQVEDSTQIFRVIMSDITELKKAYDKISSLLSEKETILKEVHHRIKNNINTTMSTLSLHLRSINDPVAANALSDAKSRLNTMYVLYNKLYRSDNLMHLSLKEYLDPLITEIIQLYPNLEKVKLTKIIDDVLINVQLLPTIGMIINELLTNIAKYAFIDRDSGEINITASAVNNHFTLMIKDNGAGIKNISDLKNSKGLGLQLINLLSEQLDGKMKVDSNNGTCFTLEFDFQN